MHTNSLQITPQTFTFHNPNPLSSSSKFFIPTNFTQINQAMKRHSSFQSLDLNFDATELRLGLPRTEEREQELQSESAKQSKIESRSGSDSSIDPSSDAGDSEEFQIDHRPPAKAQVVGWPPVRSYRKNVTIEAEKKKEKEKKIVKKELGIIGGMYVKVSLDGAPYLRKIDLKLYQSYEQLLDALENMFNFKLGSYREREGYNGCDYVPTYEDKDGDWMMVGDVPWNMFISGCKRLRMMKGSETRGLACTCL